MEWRVTVVVAAVVLLAGCGSTGLVTTPSPAPGEDAESDGSATATMTAENETEGTAGTDGTTGNSSSGEADDPDAEETDTFVSSPTDSPTESGAEADSGGGSSSSSDGGTGSGSGSGSSSGSGSGSESGSSSQSTPTGTESPTPTDSPSPTPSPTGTPSPTESATPTDSPTPTESATPSPTPTSTPGLISTPTPVETPEPDDGLDRTHPDGNVEVQPGTPVVFEVSTAEGSIDMTAVEWTVYEWNRASGEWEASRSASSETDPAMAAFESATGTVPLQSRFDEGWYRVEARRDDGEASGTATWRIHATNDAPDAPELEPTEPTSTTVFYDEGYEWGTELDGETPPYRVFWFAAGCDRVLGITTVDGDDGTPSWGYDVNEYRDCPLRPFTVGDNGMVASQQSDRDLEFAAPLTLEIDDTNDPVQRGEFLEVTAQVENVGTERHEQDVALRVEAVGEVDRTTVDLAPGEETTVEFTYETDDEREEFDVIAFVDATEYTVDDTAAVAVEDAEPDEDG